MWKSGDGVEGGGRGELIFLIDTGFSFHCLLKIFLFHLEGAFFSLFSNYFF